MTRWLLRYPLLTRSVIVATITALTSLTVPASAQRKAATASALPPPKVSVNRTVPRVTPPPLEPVFSARPTAAEIFRARVFAEPIVPVGDDPSAEETAALAQALLAFHRSASLDWRPSLGAFLDRYPSSPWRASLLANIGTLELQRHAHASALRAWDEAWTLAWHLMDARARAVADFAIAEWLLLAASFGQTDVVEARVQSLGDRALSGPAGVKIRRARENAGLTKRYPDLARFCGPEALRALLEARDGPRKPMPAALLQPRGDPRGMTLTEVRDLGRRSGVNLRIVRRVDADAVPAQSIVHWSIGHYGVITRRRDNRYEVIDRARNEVYWLDADTLFREASGYFLVPEEFDGPGWASVTDDEGHRLRGSGPLCPDGAAPPAPPEPPVCGGSCAGGGAGGGGNSGPPGMGMAIYRFQSLTASLLLYDTPLTYRPARGPAVPLTVSYHHRDWVQPQIFTFANLGPKWQMDLLRYLKEEPTDALGVTPPHVWVLIPPSGREVYTGPDGAGVYPAHPNSRAVLVRVSSSPIRYERRLRDGSVEVYGQSDGAAPGARRVFLTEVLDPHGERIQLTWDAQGRLVAVEDALGQVTTLSYALGSDPLKVTSITDPFSRQATFTYNAAGQLETITDAIGFESRFAYGPADVVTGLTTPYGTTTFRHESTSLNSSFGTRFVEATDPMGGTERVEFQYENPSLPAGEAVAPAGFAAANADLNRRNTFYWTPRAYAAAGADPANAVVTHWLMQPEWEGWQIYSAVAHSVKRPLESRVWYAYPGQQPGYEQYGGWFNQPSSVARVLDDGSTQVFQTTYNSQGQVLTRTDPLGRQTSYTYAANGVDLLTVRQTTGAANDMLAAYGSYVGHQPQTMTDAAGQMTTFTYNAAGQVVTVINALNEATTYGYTGNGELATITGPVSGATTTLTYDGYGRVRTVAEADGYAVTTDYDAFDRPIRITYPDGTYEAMTYDRLDRAAVRDRLGRMTRYFFDGMRRLVGTRDPLGRTVTQVWCGCGSLDALIDGKGQGTSWERDALGRVTAEVRANGSGTQFAYEATTSRLKRRTDAKGQQTHYAYFRDDALAGLSFTNATVATPSVSYTYDAVYGRLATMVDGTGTTTYGYHPAGAAGGGQLASVDGPLQNDTITYAYDAIGRVTSRAVNGVAVTWTFDALGRATSEASVLGTFTYGFDGVTSRLASVAYPNGQTSTYSYLPGTQDRRLQTIHHKFPGGATLSRFDYTYDAVGNIVTWQQQADADPAILWTYGYDAADQLVSAVKTTTAAPVQVLARYGYGYDAAANRTFEQIDDAITLAAYDNMNRLTTQTPGGPLAVEGLLSESATVTIQGKPVTVTGTTFRGAVTVTAGTNAFTVTATDPSGNTRTQTYEVPISGQPRTFTYDANGNLTSDGTRIFTWDAVNRLTRVQSSGNEVARFTYDGLGRRAEKLASNVTHIYVYEGSSVAEERLTGGPAETIRYFHGPGIDDWRGRQNADGSLTYFVADAIGSIAAETNSAGQLTLARAHDPWGNLDATSTSGSGLSFTGREWDPETQLFFYRARYYDPKVGRFTSEDPIGLNGGGNFYRYVDNSPVLAGDPSGLSAYLYCEVIPSNRGGKLVGRLALAITQARHCYIRVTCPGKYDITLELYGPQPGWPNGKPMKQATNPSRNQAAGSPNTIYPPGCSKDPNTYEGCPKDCSFEDELINQFNHNQSPPPYNPLGPNSNTFAAKIIQGAGGRAVFPPAAYGCVVK